MSNKDEIIRMAIRNRLAFRDIEDQAQYIRGATTARLSKTELPLSKKYLERCFGTYAGLGYLHASTF